MIEQASIERIVKEVVSANTAPNAVVSVSSQDDFGWDGDPIVRVSIVLEKEAASKLGGDASINILAQLREGFESIGEKRFPIIDYATTEEMAVDGHH